MLHQFPSSSSSSPTEVFIPSKISLKKSSPPSQQQYLDLKLGQIVHRRKLTSFYSPARDSNGLQTLQTRSPNNYQVLFSKIYTRDPQQIASQILPNRVYTKDPQQRDSGSLPPSTKYHSTIPRSLQQQYPDSELGQIVHQRNQKFLSI